MEIRPILIHEVGLRDGLQMEHSVVPTETKLQWLQRMIGCGLPIIQVGSFVHPKLVPQMADTDALFRQAQSLRTGSAPVFSGLVLNEKGLDRGLEVGVELFCMGVSASETHSMKNTRMSVEQATGEIIGMAGRAVQSGARVQVSVQSAFGCGYEGPIPEEKVVSIVKRYLEAGLHDISLADTAGHADPERVRCLFGRILELDPRSHLTCHFHNTYGMALANCIAAYEAGVESFESSIAGLGGCPFTAVAGGNTCTEDMVHMFHRMGLDTGVRLEPAVELAREVAGFIGRDLPGAVYRTGPIPTAAPSGTTN